MDNNLRLFERLYDDYTLQIQKGDSVIVASVKANLRRLFSSRKNSVRSCPDFGLRMFEDYENPDLSDVADDLKKQIENYEPRVTNVTVTYTAHKIQQSLVFNINAMINNGSGEKILLQVMLDSNIFNITA